MLASYEHFLTIAAESQWDEAAIDLGPDAAAWPELPDADRSWLGGVIASFRLGESALAAELERFEASVDGTLAAACFKAQRRDEARHARFFSRLAGEVTGSDPAAASAVPAATPFAELFERRMPATAERLAAGEAEIAEAVGLCHMLLEGCVLGVGQTALLAWLEARPAFPGIRRGVELVARDERWHLGFGARLLQDAEVSDALRIAIAEEGDQVLATWRGLLDDELLDRARLVHRRRLRAAGLLERQS